MVQNSEYRSQAFHSSEKWGWFVALGVALIMGGGIAFGNVMAATVASVYYVGMRHADRRRYCT
jgi:uncharacterized membrane protein HdeD (DUF308 family)